MATILILDDYELLREEISELIGACGLRPAPFASAKRAHEYLAEGGSADVFIVDLLLQGGESGETFIEGVIQEFGIPPHRFVVCTAYASRYPTLPHLSEMGVVVVHQTRGWTSKLIEAIETALATTHD